jgi:hypothetical protein
MTKNKGKPSKQKADERKEDEASSEAPKSIHRLDRSRSDEKGARGEMARRPSQTKKPAR